MVRRSKVRALTIATLAAAIVLALATAVLAAGAGASDVGGAGVVAKPKPKPKPKPQPASTLKGTGIIRWGDTYPTASGYERFSYVLVSRHMAGAASKLPGKTLVYMNGTTIYRDWSTGVSFQEAIGSGWLLRDANGNHLTNARFNGYVGDVGNRAYQERFIANVTDFLRKKRVDGVFIDDVRASPLGLNGAFPAKYPHDQAWEEATLSFVATVGPALRARGFYVMVNAEAYFRNDWASNTGEQYARFYKRIAPHVDGIMNEYWMQNPVDITRMRSLGSSWYEYWNGWQALVSVTQAAGADFFGLMYGSGGYTRAMRYGRASFLLDWNGRGGAFIWVPTDRNDPYHPVSVKQLGLPVAAKFERMPGVWQRRYEGGMVVLNATSSPVSVRVEDAVHTVGPTDAVFARIRKR